MTDETPHIRVAKWDEFQHYKNRDPPWIKLYNRLLDDYEYGCLQDASKAHLTGIWMLASRCGNRIPLDLEWIANKIHATEPLDLRPLVSAGFIEVYHADSKPLAQDASNTLAFARSREGEGETEAEAEERKEGGSSLRSSPPSDLSENEDAQSEEGEDPVPWMHEIWHDELGIEGHRIKLTEKRRTKYRKMYDEQLAATLDPQRAWRMILRRVQMSEHHMSERSYQMPESILRNEERRETWVQRTLDAARHGTTGASERKEQIQNQHLAEQIRRRREERRRRETGGE